MDISSQFIFSPDSESSTLRKGGILLKGKSRLDRQAVHMMMLVDTSGSMESDHKLESVKRSLSTMLLLLSEEDRLSLITFDDVSKCILKQITPNPAERDAISYRISSLRTDGSTNMSSGLLDARDCVEPSSSGRKQGLLLLTDGHANMGVSSTDGLIGIVQRILQEQPGLSITSVGYGVDHNSELLTEIAKHGGGAYNVVKDLSDVATTFGDVLGGLVSVSAQRVAIEFPAGYTVKTAYPQTTETNGTIRVVIGDLYAETEIAVLFEGAPSLGAIRVVGTDMATLNSIEEILSPSFCSTTDEFLLSFIMSEYRTRVADLLTKSRMGRGYAPQLRSLLTELETNLRIQSHPMTVFLKEDIQVALNIQERNRNITQQETTEMAQHSAYIGLTRGLRSHTTPLAPPQTQGLGLRRQYAVGILDPTLSPHASPRPGAPNVSPSYSNPADYDPEEAREVSFLSPTANAQQRHMASLMRTLSSQTPD